jgi:hypothetical protein
MNFTDIFDFVHVGESNAGDPGYACKFTKMIQYWRQIWNERTYGITDIQFPFGFVQVSFTRSRPKEFLSSALYIFLPNSISFIIFEPQRVKDD